MSGNASNDCKRLGAWFHEADVDALATSFASAVPFPHVVLDGFLATDFAADITRDFPAVDDSWHEYRNPIEVKRSRNDVHNMPHSIQLLFRLLASPAVVDRFQAISGLRERLESDPTLHGAGLHAHPRYGRLNVHLDYERHPILEDKERRLNLILFVNQEWDASWGGANELWSDPEGVLRKKTDVRFNRAILFRTDNTSWHGVPDIIRCPPGYYRHSIAFYYISDLSTRPHFDHLGDDGTGYRRKAMFVRHPYQTPSDALDTLLSIRPLRRITDRDMGVLFPQWSPVLSPDRSDAPKQSAEEEQNADTTHHGRSADSASHGQGRAV